MFYGQGAGGAPTASAVVGDLVSAARHRVLGGTGPQRSSYAEIPILPAGEVRTHFQLRLRVADEPGVLAQVSQQLAEQQVSIDRKSTRLNSSHVATSCPVFCLK